MQLTIKGGIMQACTQKQNITHECSKPSRLVNQDSTQKQSELKYITFVDSSLHKQRLITQVDRAFIPCYLDPWIWMEERVLQVPKIENL